LNTKYKRRETKERLKKSLLNESMRQSDEEDDFEDDMMDVEDDQPVKKFKKLKLSPEDMEEMKKKEKAGIFS
jgi:hypothetical protein